MLVEVLDEIGSRLAQSGIEILRGRKPHRGKSSSIRRSATLSFSATPK